MNKQSIFIFLKKMVFFTLPFLGIFIIYLMVDPFKVIRDYPSYYTSGNPAYIFLNRDHVSTSTFDMYSSLNNYNSFILGNSRSLFYEINDWKPYLNSNSSCFHFDASGENLYGIYKKAKYLDKRVSNLDNILLILDYDTLIGIKPRSGHLYIISPQLENYKNFFEFHTESIKAFLTPKFLFAFVDLNLFDELRPYMKRGGLVDDRPFVYDSMSNEIRYEYFEKMINRDENLYYVSRRHVFYERTGKVKYYPPCILDKQKVYLEEIRKIFHKRKTNYKIIINPLYDQIGLNKDDAKYLCRIFGERHVFNFSGINKYTNNYKNYYEASHYRPHVARKIIEEVYKK